MEPEYYEVSEICQYIGNEGYDIKGTVQHPVGVDDLAGILDRLPARDRSIAEHIIIEVGIEVEVDLEGLCKPESTEGGRQVSVLKWPKGAPLNLE